MGWVADGSLKRLLGPSGAFLGAFLPLVLPLPAGASLVAPKRRRACLAEARRAKAGGSVQEGEKLKLPGVGVWLFRGQVGRGRGRRLSEAPALATLRRFQKPSSLKMAGFLG